MFSGKIKITFGVSSKMVYGKSTNILKEKLEII